MTGEDQGRTADRSGSADTSNAPTARRRSTHVAHDVVYVAVGASSAADLMEFPPEGSTPFELELRLGSGSDRYLAASSLLMTWRAQRGAGIEVRDIEAGEGDGYVGVTFDAEGRPQPPEADDVRYGPDGEPFLTDGSTAVFCWPGKRGERRIRVVYTIDGPGRTGFAWGTADDAGAVGEQVIAVEHREDDTVWGTARGFLWGSNAGPRGTRGRSGIKALVASAREQLAALGPGAPVAQDDKA